MEWYYVVGGERRGPVSDEQLDSLVRQGEINARTLVWREGMPDWLALEEVRARSTATDTSSAGPLIWCDLCGRQVGQDETLVLQGKRVCSECKPIAVERVREGIPLVSSSSHPYAGFWIRFAAKFIDGIILGVFNQIVLAVTGLGTFQTYEPAEGDQAIATILISNLVMLAASCAYNTLFVGAYGGTPGKLLCGLRIVQPDGTKVSYLRALGRYFAEILSWLIFLIGYLMAAFDSQKRTLHDRIASTRVIHAKKR
ncbi:MAG: RDD family protein [Planctomycetota bacterium]